MEGFYALFPRSKLMKIVLSLAILVSVAAVLSLPASGCELTRSSNGDDSSTAMVTDRFILKPLTIELKIKPNSSNPEIEQLRARIEAMPEVKDVVFTSQQEALEILRKRLGEDEYLLPADLAWELSPTFNITLEDDASVDEVAARFEDDPVIDTRPSSGGVSHHAEPWSLDLRDDNTFVLSTEDSVSTGTYRIFRDSITLIEETGDLDILEGTVSGTTIQFEAIPGTWTKA